MGEHPTDWKDIDPDWYADLHRNTETVGDELAQGIEPGKRGLSAEEIKELQRGSLRALTDEQLREIPVLPQGSHLRQGATYLDLSDPQRRPFTAMGGMTAEEGHYYVPKDNISYILWNLLIGVTNPERLDIGEEQ